MSAAMGQPRGGRLPVVNDNDLLYLVGRRHVTALRLMLYIRKRAMIEGRLQVKVRNVDIQQDLGLDRRQVQRAKAYLRELGFPIIERVGRARGQNGQCGSLSCLFVVDRRRIRALGGGDADEDVCAIGDRPGAVPDAAADEGMKHQPALQAPDGAVEPVGGRAAARDGPPLAAVASTETPNREPAPPARPDSPSPCAGSVEQLEQWPVVDRGLPVASQLEPELAALRSWLAAARGSALDGERAAAVLDRAVAHVVREGGSPFRARLARSLLAQQLGADQLSFPRAGDAPEVPGCDAVDDQIEGGRGGRP